MKRIAPRLRPVLAALLAPAAAAIPCPAQAARWNEQEVQPPGLASNDQFGFAVAISGEWAVIGAPGDDEMGFGAGAAYVFHDQHATGRWVQHAKLLPPDGAPSRSFGYSVAIDGEFALLGAKDDSELGPRAGAAYVFRLDPMTSQWAFDTKLLAWDGAPLDSFGAAVALGGATALIGSWQAYGTSYQSGAAYVFVREPASGAWSSEAKLVATDGAAFDHFGRSVSISKDCALVSAPGHEHQIGHFGTAYVFRRDPLLASWSQEAELQGLGGAGIGSAVSLYADRALVGASADQGSVMRSGSAYLFVRDELSSTWEVEQKLFASDGETLDWFGARVSLSDGLALIGAPNESENGYQAGAVYVFRDHGEAHHWVQESKIFPSRTAYNEHFGNVSLDGNQALVGAPSWCCVAPGTAFFISPFFAGSTSTLSAAAGGTIELELDFPAPEGGNRYSVLGSVSGTAGARLPGGVFVPLVRDELFGRFSGGGPPRGFEDAFGTLDALGDASSRFTVPAGHAAGQIGRSVWFAAVSWRPGGSSYVASLSSQAIVVIVRP